MHPPCSDNTQDGDNNRHPHPILEWDNSQDQVILYEPIVQSAPPFVALGCCGAATVAMFHCREPKFRLHKFAIFDLVSNDPGAGGIFISEKFLPGWAADIRWRPFSLGDGRSGPLGCCCALLLRRNPTVGRFARSGSLEGYCLEIPVVIRDQISCRHFQMTIRHRKQQRPPTGPASRTTSLLAILLDRRARHGPVRTEHAAIARLGLKAGSAALAVVEKLAGIGWHRFNRGVGAMGAGDS